MPGIDITPQHFARAITAYVVLLFSLSVHESAHAWTASRLGDDTARDLGRVTLNPIPHIDLVGTVLMPLLMFLGGGLPLLAWAKPTPYVAANFRRDVPVRRGHMLVAVAGPLSNFALALVFTAALYVVARLAGGEGARPVVATVSLGVELNVVLALFNLLPIPPLDGSKVASFSLPASIGDRYDRIVGPYGFAILLILVMTGWLWRILGPILAVIVGFLSGLVA